jgi:hypothetical protein
MIMDQVEEDGVVESMNFFGFSIGYILDNCSDLREPPASGPLRGATKELEKNPQVL